MTATPIPCFEKVHWGTSQVLFPGTRHSLPDDMFPWECVSEIVPGLFLTCDGIAKDRENCLRAGYSLVMNFCAGTYNRPYRVYSHNTQTEKMEWTDFETLQDFCCALNSYVSSPVPELVQERKVFLYNVSALDIPTYDISQHFLLSSTLIELVIACRETLKGCSMTEDQLHNVVVHCMVGVSRSASVVAAYLMKRAQLGVEDALAFMQSTRPVVGPNPGFRRQLGMWESLLMLHFDDALSADLVIAELKERHNLVEVVTELLPLLLENSKCASERRYFGYIVGGSLDSPDQLTLIRRELLSAAAALVDSETYVDSPKFFAHVCEIVRSAEKFVPQFLSCFADGRSEGATSVPWNDSAYRFVFIDLARSGYVKDTYDTTRAFSSLMEMIQTKHFDDAECPCARLLDNDYVTPVSHASFIKFSFPFLHFIAPYGEGFVPYGELSDLQKRYPVSGDVLTEDELEALVQQVRNLFVSRFLLSTCGGVRTESDSEGAPTGGRWPTGSQLKHLEEDVEVVVFEALEHEPNVDNIMAMTHERCFADALPEAVCLTAGQKTVGAIIAFRLLIETAEQFVFNSYSGRISSQGAPLQYTESVFPIAAVLTAMNTIGELCVSRCNVAVDMAAYFRAALEPAYLAEVIHPDGVWAMLNTD